MVWCKIFKQTKLKPFKKRIFGFDIETYNNNKNFLLASLYGKYEIKDRYGNIKEEEYKKTFYSKQDVINELKTGRFRNSFIVATNLQFDFFGTFENQEEMMGFHTLFRSSQLISAKTYYNTLTKKFQKNSGSGCFSITFIDTLNFAQMSVDKLGKLVGVSKMETPSFIGKYPKNKKEWDYMIEYNLRDSEVSQKGLKFLFKSFYELGATPKMTIASTTMSLFKNRYLKDKIYFRHSKEDLLEEFKAYYGGRTESYSRGTIKKHFYYDFNSLYPSVMLNKFPDPNTMRTTFKNNTHYIEEYEGISEVLITTTNEEYPLLPYRCKVKNKLLFPIGTFKGWYSHVELREAINNGYVIKKVYKTKYFTGTCEPFKDFVLDLYGLRKTLKTNKNSMEYVVKILMNSLYGKFGQKFENMDNFIPANLTIEEMDKYDTIERVGQYFRVGNKSVEPSAFCIPIWALYVTAYARIKMYRAIKKCKPVYVDTDSLITTKKLNTSDELGELKLEMYIKEGVIVKPKMYAIDPLGKQHYVKAKGVGKRLNRNEFDELLLTKKIRYNKFMKVKEASRRKLITNEIIEINKEFTLNDDKRDWKGKNFDAFDLQHSLPLTIVFNEFEDHKVPTDLHPNKLGIISKKQI